MPTVDILSTAFVLDFQDRQLEPVRAVPTPLAGWNNVCRDDGGGLGLAKGWLTVIGGNPKFGKSILALNLAAKALMSGERIGIVSLEMTPVQLAARFYAIMSGTPMYRMEKGSFSRDHFAEAVATIRMQLDHARKPVDGVAFGSDDDLFLVTDTPMSDIERVLADLNDMHARGIRWFVIDYLQLIGTGDEESINKQVAEVTTHIARFTKATQSTVVALSQFNRRTSADYTQPPRAQGLHGGMIVEATADQVILLDHSRYEKRDKGYARSWLLIDLNRHGESGSLPIEWNYNTLTLREALPDEEIQWPK